MMKTDWKAEIARLVYWKQVIAENDKSGALPWKLPRVGAKPEEMADVEAALHQKLPTQYREFLSLANGWEGFYVCTNLFGTSDLAGQLARSVMERLDVQAYMSSSPWSLGEVMPIGGSDVDVDVFLLVLDDATNLPGGVVWLAGEEVDRYSSFHDFFAAMVNYNARIANKLAEQNSKASL